VDFPKIIQSRKFGPSIYPTSEQKITHGMNDIKHNLQIWHQCTVLTTGTSSLLGWSAAVIGTDSGAGLFLATVLLAVLLAAGGVIGLLFELDGPRPAHWHNKIRRYHNIHKITVQLIESRLLMY
jgi:hypothetical protein